MKKKDIEALILWYETNKRDLPWRHTKDPYKIWISETMLQQPGWIPLFHTMNVF